MLSQSGVKKNISEFIASVPNTRINVSAVSSEGTVLVWFYFLNTSVKWKQLRVQRLTWVQALFVMYIVYLRRQMKSSLVSCLRASECSHPHFAGEIWKRSRLFLRLDQPFTLSRHENGTFRKRSWKRRDLKTSAFRFRVDGQYFGNDAFGKGRRHDNHVIFLPESPTLTGNCSVFKISFGVG